MAITALVCLPSMGSEGVVQTVQESAKDNNRISVCIHLAKSNEPTTKVNVEAKKKSVERVLETEDW